MTNQHPLTDEMIEEMTHSLDRTPWYDDWLEDYETDCIKKGMRTAYDKGGDDMLEQVIKYLEDDLPFVLWSNHFTVSTYMDKFKKAMRPQQQEDQ